MERPRGRRACFMKTRAAKRYLKEALEPLTAESPEAGAIRREQLLIALLEEGDKRESRALLEAGPEGETHAVARWSRELLEAENDSELKTRAQRTYQTCAQQVAGRFTSN